MFPPGATLLKQTRIDRRKACQQSTCYPHKNAEKEYRIAHKKQMQLLLYFSGLGMRTDNAKFVALAPAWSWKVKIPIVGEASEKHLLKFTSLETTVSSVSCSRKVGMEYNMRCIVPFENRYLLTVQFWKYSQICLILTRVTRTKFSGRLKTS